MTPQKRAKRAQQILKRRLHAEIVYQHRSLAKFDRMLGRKVGYTSQRLREKADVELKVSDALLWMAVLDLHPADFMEEIVEELARDEQGETGITRKARGPGRQGREFLAAVQEAQSLALNLVRRKRRWSEGEDLRAAESAG